MSRSHVYFVKGVKPSFTKYTLFHLDGSSPSNPVRAFGAVRLHRDAEGMARQEGLEPLAYCLEE